MSEEKKFLLEVTNADRITELEKKLDGITTDSVNILISNKDRIEKLEKDLDGVDKIQDRNWKGLKKELSELKASSARQTDDLEKKWLSCKNYSPNEERCFTFQCKECNLYKPKEERPPDAMGKKEVAELVDYDLYSHEGVMVYDAKTQIIVEKADLEWLFKEVEYYHEQLRRKGVLNDIHIDKYFELKEKYLSEEDKNGNNMQ